ncbi:MAG TPA: hypothetical protein VKA18_12870 [Alphaproteobacteria bacterium]|nr:hypothetical protein [Alphaproteobacteria bacterium]
MAGDSAAILLDGPPAYAEAVFGCSGCTHNGYSILQTVAGQNAVILNTVED